VTGERNDMTLPSSKELSRVRKKLAKVEPTRGLPPNASKTDQLKFELCKQFVVYLRVHEITQKALAEQLGMEPARLNEIVKYRIDLFAVDRLLDYLEKLKPDITVTVA
jgi:predicted XRE-type DNA-binding protein